MKDIKKIDVHAHAMPWPEYSPEYLGLNSKKPSAEELFTEYYSKLNVEKCVWRFFYVKCYFFHSFGEVFYI